MPDERPDPSFERLLSALDARRDQLSEAAYLRFAAQVPVAARWNPEQRANFVRQAEGRFGAILAVMSHEIGEDSALRADLEEVGANAAWAGSSLGHLLMVLRISRDLLLTAATGQSGENGPYSIGTLGTFSERLILATDHLLDALVNGFWSAKLAQQKEELHRLTSVVDGSSYGVYEADIDGIVQYANAKLGVIVGYDSEKLKGAPLAQLFRPTGGTGSVAALLAEPPGDAAEVAFTIEGPTGETVELDINTVVRRIDGAVVGFGGIVRRSASMASAVADESVFGKHLQELHLSLDVLVQSAGVLHRNATDMNSAQIVQAGESLQRQAERLVEVVQELEAERTTAGL